MFVCLHLASRAFSKLTACDFVPRVIFSTYRWISAPPHQMLWFNRRCWNIDSYRNVCLLNVGPLSGHVYYKQICFSVRPLVICMVCVNEKLAWIILIAFRNICRSLAVGKFLRLWPLSAHVQAWLKNLESKLAMKNINCELVCWRGQQKPLVTVSCFWVRLYPFLFRQVTPNLFYDGKSDLQSCQTDPPVPYKFISLFAAIAIP